MVGCSEMQCGVRVPETPPGPICGNSHSSSTTSSTTSSDVSRITLADRLGFWSNREIVYFIDKKWPVSHRGVTFPHNIHRVADKWSQPGCSDLRLIYGGEVDRPVNYREPCEMATPGAIYVHLVDSDWKLPSHFLGYALICRSGADNEFFSVTVLINGGTYKLSNSHGPADRSEEVFDFETILMHEFGHAIGISHAEAAGEVMTSSIASGSKRHNLTAGDIKRLCDIYPSESRPNQRIIDR